MVHGQTPFAIRILSYHPRTRRPFALAWFALRLDALPALLVTWHGPGWSPGTG